MKQSNKVEAPESVLNWIRVEEGRLGEKPAFATLQRPEKDDLRLTLLKEQGFLCAYCGRALSADFSDSHIDHFWPQTIFDGTGGHDDLRLDHDNLFQSCGPSSLPSRAARGLPYTCGAAKDDWYDEQHSIMPSEEDCELRFMYDAAGQVSPTEDDDQAARNMIERLRLDDAALNNERKKIVQELEQDVLGQSPTVLELREEIDSWLEVDEAGRLSGFAQVARRYLEVEAKL